MGKRVDQERERDDDQDRGDPAAVEDTAHELQVRDRIRVRRFDLRKRGDSVIDERSTARAGVGGGPAALRVEPRDQAIELLANASGCRAAVADPRGDRGLGREAGPDLRRQPVIDCREVGIADLGETDAQRPRSA